MKKQEIYKISTVSEYLDIIRTKNLREYIYRGQNERYYGIEASGFRPYKGGWKSDKFYNMKEMQKEYYKKIITRLYQEEKKHFIAFSQHHGLPTNLVDFTYSPLVALFFACEGKESSDKNAEVYLINKNRVLDITDTIVNVENENLLEALMYDERVQIEILYEMIKLFESDVDNIYNQII